MCAWSSLIFGGVKVYRNTGTEPSESSTLESSVGRSVDVLGTFSLRSLLFICNNTRSNAIAARLRSSQGQQTGGHEDGEVFALFYV